MTVFGGREQQLFPALFSYSRILRLTFRRMEVIAAFRAAAGAVSGQVVAAEQASPAPSSPPAERRPASDGHRPQADQRHRHQPEGKHHPGETKRPLLGRGEKERGLSRGGIVAQWGLELCLGGSLRRHAQEVKPADAVLQVDIKRLIESEVKTIMNWTRVAAIPEGDIEREKNQCDQSDELGDQRATPPLFRTTFEES